MFSVCSYSHHAQLLHTSVDPNDWDRRFEDSSANALGIDVSLAREAEAGVALLVIEAAKGDITAEDLEVRCVYSCFVADGVAFVMFSNVCGKTPGFDKRGIWDWRCKGQGCGRRVR